MGENENNKKYQQGGNILGICSHKVGRLVYTVVSAVYYINLMTALWKDIWFNVLP